MKKHSRLCSSILTVSVALFGSGLYADPAIEAAAQVFAEQSMNTWLTDPLIVSAIKVQNQENANLVQSDIDALDKQWRKETTDESQPMIDRVTGNPLSLYLREVKEKGEGLVTEIFIMDNNGLNVGQSDITSDYWQGDEDKWQKTFNASPNSVFVDEVEKDESTQTFQTQISIAITDPETGKNIGAVTIGVDAEGLLMQ